MLIQRAWLATEVGGVGWADRNESGLGQHFLTRDILAGRGRPQFTQPVPCRRQPAQLPQGRSRHAATGDMLRYPVAELRGSVLDLVEVEPAQYRTVLVDEHIEGAAAGLLLDQQSAVPLRELIVELVAAVGDRSGEVRAVR